MTKLSRKLSQNGIFRSSQEGFHFQVLLDPFEEKLNLPTFFVQSCNLRCWQLEIVSQKFIPLSSGWFRIFNQPKISSMPGVVEQIGRGENYFLLLFLYPTKPSLIGMPSLLILFKAFTAVYISPAWAL